MATPKLDIYNRRYRHIEKYLTSLPPSIREDRNRESEVSYTLAIDLLYLAM